MCLLSQVYDVFHMIVVSEVRECRKLPPCLMIVLLYVSVTAYQLCGGCLGQRRKGKLTQALGKANDFCVFIIKAREQ